MRFDNRADGALVVCQPWERFAVIDMALLDPDPDAFLFWDSSQSPETVSFRVSNGWARYRLVGRCPEPRDTRSIWELIEGEYAAPRQQEVSS
jgi:hypothetical protein